MIRLGQMTNNRQGLNLNVQWETKKFKFSGGMGASSEIEAAADLILDFSQSNPFGTY